MSVEEASSAPSKSKTLTGTLWSMLERFSIQGTSFVVMLLMARVLTPADYGLVGMITIFIYVAQSLIDSGFSQALIRKLDRTQTDNCTTFYFNIAMGVAIYVMMWFLAPAIAKFYEEPLLVPITRIICLGIVFNSLTVVQRAVLTIEMDFKTQAKATFFATATAGVTGIVMAYTGFGVWSIVAYQILNTSLNCGFLWLMSKWRPSLLYSWQSFRHLFGFGFKLALAGFFQSLYNNAYIMVIGKVFKVSDLGQYTRANQFQNFIAYNFTNIVQRVSYPVLCRYQNDIEELRKKFYDYLKTVSFFMFALNAGVAGVAKPLILSLLNPEWLYSAVLLQILCFGGMWNWTYSLNLNILLVVGRSDLFLKLDVIKKIIFIGILFASIPLGLEGVCWGLVLSNFIEVFINSYYTGRFIGVGIWRQLKVLLPGYLITLTMGFVMYFVTEWLEMNSWLELIIGAIVGIIYLLVVCKFTGNNEMRRMLKLVKKR